MWTERKAQRYDAGLKQFKPGTGEKKTIFGWWTIHWEANQVTDSGVGGMVDAKAPPNRPGFGNRLRTVEEFRMRRLAGGERSTRFEPASQHSQLPLLRTGGHPSKSTFHACVCQALTEADLDTLSETPSSLRLGPCHFSGSNPFVKLLACQKPQF